MEVVSGSIPSFTRRSVAVRQTRLGSMTDFRSQEFDLARRASLTMKATVERGREKTK